MSIQNTDYISVVTATIEYGDTTLRFCDADEDFSVGGDTFTSDPLLRAENPERSGSLEEDDGTLFLSSEWQFLFDAALGRAFPTIKVSVVEYVLPDQVGGTQNAETIYHFRGRASVIELNPDGEEGVAKLTLLNPKQRTESPLDNLALERCRNDFGSGKVCQFGLSTADDPGTLTAISRNSVTITGLPTRANRWYEDGYVEYQGLRIKIRYWTSGTSFVLTQVPPVQWEETLPLSVDVYPGCDRSVANCKTFGQTPNFRGIGIDIPEFHPVFQKPRIS